MKIKDRIEYKTKPRVLTFSSEDMVIKAIKEMSDKNYGASVIVDNGGKPIGIVTERDFMRRLLFKGLDANTTPLSKIMTSDLKVASEEDDVVEWLRIMSNERFRHLPIVDDQGKLLNLMSQGDFVSYTWPQLLTRAKDMVVKSFLERFHLHMIVVVFMIYSIILMFAIRSVK